MCALAGIMNQSIYAVTSKPQCAILYMMIPISSLRTDLKNLKQTLKAIEVYSHCLFTGCEHVAAQ